jgi:hypothetical protein
MYARRISVWLTRHDEKTYTLYSNASYFYKAVFGKDYPFTKVPHNFFIFNCIFIFPILLLLSSDTFGWNKALYIGLLWKFSIVMQIPLKYKCPLDG